MPNEALVQTHPQIAADLIVESMSLGATGWVSGMTNVWPKECVSSSAYASRRTYSEARAFYRILTPSFHLDTHVKLVQYIKLAEKLVYGAPEWTRSPRLPVVGIERDRVVATITNAVDGLASLAEKS